MGSYGANRRELEDQSAIKGKLEIKRDETKLVSHFWREKRRVKKRGEEKKKRRRRGRKEERYGNFEYGTYMEILCKKYLYESL